MNTNFIAIATHDKLQDIEAMLQLLNIKYEKTDDKTIVIPVKVIDVKTSKKETVYTLNNGSKITSKIVLGAYDVCIEPPTPKVTVCLQTKQNININYDVAKENLIIQQGNEE